MNLLIFVSDSWCVQMESLQAQCEGIAARSLLGTPAFMRQALELVQQYPNASDNLCLLCCRHLATNLLGDTDSSGPFEQIRELVQPCRDALQIGFEDVLAGCLRSRPRSVNFITWGLLKELRWPIVGSDDVP